MLLALRSLVESAGATFTATVADVQAATTSAAAESEVFTGATVDAQATDTSAVTAIEAFIGATVCAQTPTTSAGVAVELFTAAITGAAPAGVSAAVALVPDAPAAPAPIPFVVTVTGGGGGPRTHTRPPPHRLLRTYPYFQREPPMATAAVTSVGQSPRSSALAIVSMVAAIRSQSPESRARILVEHDSDWLRQALAEDEELLALA